MTGCSVLMVGLGCFAIIYIKHWLVVQHGKKYFLMPVILDSSVVRQIASLAP